MAVVVALLAILPSILRTPYLIGVAITTLMYVALALGFDVIVGRTGLLSLAVAGFFGIGAYAAALVALQWHGELPLQLLIGILAPSIAALLVGIPSFRLSYHSFAMGTLAFALIAQVVALNWIEVTRGPLCLSGIPPASLQIGDWSWAAQSLRDSYYLMLLIAVVTFLVARQVERTRVGRTLSAIRDDELLAAGVGTPVLRYKLLAFILGAGIAGAVGAFYASYASVVCPSELAFVYTVNLIVILFLGGRGTLAGPILAAILFTAVPELLRATQAWRLVIYGLLIIVGAIYMPEGIVTTTLDWVLSRLPTARRGSMGDVLLRVDQLTKHFGGIAAVNGVSLEVRAGEIVGLIGPNGSGKTTLFNCVTGFLRPDQPSAIEVMGRQVTRWRPDRIARLGMVRTFQEIRVFTRLSLVDNLLMALQQHQEDRLLRRFLNTADIRRCEEQGRARARELLALVNLSPFADQPAGSLSYGQRKLLVLIAALMPDPPLILLDEPAAAVNPVLIDQMKDHIVALNQTGKTFLLVEHNMDVVMDICRRIIVLDHGEKIAEGITRGDPGERAGDRCLLRRLTTIS